MSEPLDDFTPEALVESLAYSVSMDAGEASALEEKFAELRTQLLVALKDVVFDVVLFGSLTRGTRLSVPYDPEPDIDCLLVLDQEVFSERYVSRAKGTKEPPEMLWASDIQNSLRRSSDTNQFHLNYNPPFLSLKYGSDVFELTMSTRGGHEDPEGTYLIFLTLDKQELSSMSVRDNSFEVEEDGNDDREEDDLNALDETTNGSEPEVRVNIEWSYQNSIRSSEPISPDGKLWGMIVVADPFVYNHLLEQYQRVYGDYWRHLILLWKYWLKSCDSEIRSYVIEENVFKGLQYSEPFVRASDDGSITLLHFIATYFENRNLYDYELFEGDPSFCDFRDKLISADKASRSGLKTDAFDILSSVFAPWEPGRRAR